ncbi:imm11 family protein [Agaribacterium haliotis]|uniref:imm11 family protein n=1 Tax=Agaribacterium haliotis TaxID=2013869 RepID=UPI000BB598BB|nr:DUF1629 domain-containing protein [Agaribacterium haliotis]
MMNGLYYVIERENNDNHSVFEWDQASGKYGLGAAVNDPTQLKLKLGTPIPSSPEWVDFHELPEPVLSTRLGELLLAMEIYGIELVPAIVRDPREKLESKNYVYMHVWNQIGCVNEQESELNRYKNGKIFEFEKLILNEETLAEVDENKRLIFTLKEQSSVILIHQLIKNKIEELGTTGIRFYPVNEWYSDIAFD